MKRLKGGIEMPEPVEGTKRTLSNPGANETVKKNNPEGQKDNPGEEERQVGNPVTADGGDWPRRLGWLVFAGLVLAGLAVATQGRS
ncbi:MAG: hypothetical protein AB1609_18500 [Bacillota bacterium]